MYDEYKIYGPYLSKDGRLRCILRKNNTNKTISYPKLIIENHLQRYLLDDETVDHIDGNPLNNDISNLQVLKRNIHCRLDAIRNYDIAVICKNCGKTFTITGNLVCGRNRKDRNQSGYFCSRQCSGKYGKNIQLGIAKHEIEPIIVPDKYTEKSLLL